ncbi:MAG TPA: ATP-dependent DNA ligase [Acidimicrobiia bacterium]
MDVSNAERIVFPDDGITKGDVVSYYESAADRMMPFVAQRALTVERFPKGTGSKGFMQKNAPDHFSDDLIDRHEVPKEDGGTTVYPVVKGAETIPAFANLGVITFHVPPTKVSDEERSDWIIWDLDPSSGDFDTARNAAHELRGVLERFEIDTVLMTSGSNGYHLRARLDPPLPSGETALIARGTAALGVAAHPESMTLAFRKNERGDRVFVDWLRNAPYSTSVVPWSLRARSGAPVAVPIGWEEVDDIDPNGVRLEEVSQRFGVDPWSEHRALDLVGKAEQVQSALDDAEIDIEPFDRFRS